MIGKFDERNNFDYENGFYLTSEPYRLGNIMAHYELYKMILDLPGDVIELGVFKGSSIIQFATFRELLENEKSRKIVGFDIFGAFPQVEKVESDKVFVDNWNKQHTDQFLSKEDIYKSLELKKIQNVELVQGDICKTVDEYLDSNPHTRISLLHIDTDVYEPAKVGLEKLYHRVVKGGVIVFDDYATIEGETVAVDEFFQNKEVIIKKFSFSHVKPSYIIKK
ncbi:MAG: TylF/MycF family methyltransferase [Ruminococcus flavefaciens]|nr:TylF/MycF family methyltransferase [Ruminococcus flavefaciens]